MVYHFKIVALQQVKQPDKPSKGIFFSRHKYEEECSFSPKNSDNLNRYYTRPAASGDQAKNKHWTVCSSQLSVSESQTQNWSLG